MRRTFVVSLLITAALVSLTGCASSSNQEQKTAEPKTAEKPKDKRPLAERLSVGMTKDQVREALGKPKGMTVNSDGAETWTYNDAEKHFIPYYSLSGGKTHFVMVAFDTDGKVKSWTSSEQGMY